MRTSFVTLFAALAAAVPVEKRAAAPNDGQILNYALTLEHLENHFYQQALSMFSQEDFEKAGLEGLFYNNLKEISHDEMTHVAFLTSALQGMSASTTTLWIEL